mgnify:CR=1 FL=1
MDSITRAERWASNFATNKTNCHVTTKTTFKETATPYVAPILQPFKKSNKGC